MQDIATVALVVQPTSRLKEIREGKTPRLELYDVAAHLRVSVDTVRRWDDNERLIPSKYLKPLTELLGVSADHLMGLDRGDVPAGQLELNEEAPA